MIFKRFNMAIAFLVYSVSFLVIHPVRSETVKPSQIKQNIEPQAQEILKGMTDYLKGLSQFSVEAEITEDILFDSGTKIQFGRNVTAEVQRPNKLKAHSEGDLSNGQLFYNGKTLTVLDVNTNTYSTIKAPTDIDSALLYGIKTYNLRAPLADLIYANAYEYLTDGVTAGYYIGLSKIQGQSCHHLAFRKDNIDWQIWIENDSTPLPCKLVITDKQEKEGLQFTALMKNWQTSPKLSESTFNFVPSSDAKKIDLPTLSETKTPVTPN